MTRHLLLLALPFFLQASAIAVDEFYFHRKRGLPPWELLSHPVDTLCLLACLTFALTQAYTATNLKIYLLLCLISCLLVTKDEAIHRKACTAAECWVHSLLFLLHPVVLMSVAIVWKESSRTARTNFADAALLAGFIGAAFLFLLYQIVSAVVFSNQVSGQVFDQATQTRRSSEES